MTSAGVLYITEKGYLQHEENSTLACMPSVLWIHSRVIAAAQACELTQYYHS